jgi:diacylglycerol kinase
MPLQLHTLPAAFKNAWSGILRFFRLERNGKIQGMVAVVAIAAALWLRMSRFELAFVILCCGLVIGLEMVNSAMEKLCDFVKPDYDPRIGFVKDIAAGAVLWASLLSTVAGLLLYLPHVLALFGK